MKQSVWFDEAYSIMTAKQSVSEIIRLTSLDTHPPLYYILLHFWGNLFDWQIGAVRILSVLGFAGTVFMIGLLIRRVIGIRPAVIASLMTASAPLLVRYGYEIRMYSLASFIGVGATYCIVQARNAKKHQALWWALYAVLVAVGVYTLYYTVLLWLAHLVWLIYVDYKHGNRKWYSSGWLKAYIGSVVLFLPWLSTFLNQITNGALSPIGQPMNAENMLGIISFNFLYQPIWRLSMLYSIVFVALLISLSFFVVRSFRLANKKERELLWLFSAYIGIPVLVLVLVSFFRSMYVERYLSHVAVGLMALCALSISIVTRKKVNRLAWLIVPVALGFGIFQVVSLGNYNFQRMSKPDIQQLVADIGDCHSTNVVANDPYVAIELMASMKPSCRVHFFSPDNDLKGGYALLNKSPLQIKTVDITNLTGGISYVYYDSPKLNFPSHSITSTKQYDNLNLMTLSP